MSATAAILGPFRRGRGALGAAAGAGLRRDQGWTPDGLALVVVALANGLAFEELADPGSVPPGLAARVLGALVGRGTDPAETGS